VRARSARPIDDNARLRERTEMTNFLLLHGASSTSWIWHRTTRELEGFGHDVVAPDLPCDDPDADLNTYVGVALHAASARFGEAPVVVVAQSMAGLMTPVVASRRAVSQMVLLAAMIPNPGESGFEWAASSRSQQAQAAYLAEIGLAGCDPYDPELIFVHDFDEALEAESARHLPNQSTRPLETPADFTAWPDIPTHVIAATDDRLFPLEFMRKQAQERLGVEVDTIPGGHLALLTQAPALAERLHGYVAHP
jgi:pimeloyl-ACP methyl ester carboxylesterase